ncbi:S-layer homology domain-containing protein [Paenibacillus amylolyticus]|uniref:NHL domain-containing protein n=1 Tax=Paenibacillus amylolyticus TaxID=1451 RepID=UPI003EBDCAA1
MRKKIKRPMACVLVFLLISALLPEWIGGKAYAADRYIIKRVAGTGSSGYSGDGGAAVSAQLKGPYGVAVDSNENVYIVDYANDRIRKVDKEGKISTLAGNGISGYSGDGGAATLAQLKNPTGVAVDSSGNVYIADSGNNGIRKVDKEGKISTLAGTGTAGYSGDGGAATSTQLKNPYGVAVDNSGNVYIADSGNNGIRKVDKEGKISTLAGNGISGYSGDGGAATLAQLKNPTGVAVDSSGNVYIADSGNNGIRKVDKEGKISTLAGTGTAGYSGDGGAATSAKFFSPIGVTVDSSGNVYIVDYGNQRIRKVDKEGKISTLAGTGTAGYSGDGGAATSAQLNYPRGAAVDSSGNVYIADYANYMIRKLAAPAPAHTVSASAATSTPGAGVDDAITLTVKDELGTTDTTFSGAYDVTISGYVQAPNGSYGSFNGTDLTASPNTVSVTFANGVATANLKLNKAAEQPIGLNVAGVATPAANTLSITPVAGSTATMALTTDITAPASNGGVFAQQPVVTLTDAYGNQSVSDSTTVVTVSKKDTGTWTLTGTATATASAGVVTFSGLGATNAAEVTGAQLAFDASGLVQIASQSVTLPWPGVAEPRVESVTTGDSHVLLTWSEVYGSVSYAVYQGTASGTYGDAVATVTGLTYDATGLTNGTTYYFVVKAVNPSGISAASDEVSATPQVPAPGVPVLGPTTPGDARISLTWDAVIGSTGYKIFKSTTSGAYGSEEASVTGSVYGYDVTGLTNGTTYYFVIQATNPGGDSTSSNEVSATPRTVPSAPTSVTARAGDRQAAVSFTPSGNGGSNITYYEVTAMPGNITVTGAGSPITVTGLSNGVTYTFTVQAVNSAGRSAASDTSNAVTPSSPTPAPPDPVPTPVPSTPTPDPVPTPSSPTPAPDPAPTPGSSEPTVDVFNSNIVNATNLVKTIESKVAEAKEANATIDFTDTQGHWAKKTIDIFVHLKLINGYDDGTIRPNNPITRAEFTAMLNRVFNIQAGNNTNVVLKDIDDHWAKEAVENLVAAGVIHGYTDGTFKPNQTITREEMVVMLSRIVDLNNVAKDTIKGNFNDLNGAYAASEIVAAAQAGIVSGKGNGIFDPKNNATRAEALQIILKMLELNPQLKTLLDSFS